jgi:hypothetical protein
MDEGSIVCLMLMGKFGETKSQTGHTMQKQHRDKFFVTRLKHGTSNVNCAGVSLRMAFALYTTKDAIVSIALTVWKEWSIFITKKNARKSDESIYFRR